MEGERKLGQNDAIFHITFSRGKSQHPHRHAAIVVIVAIGRVVYYWVMDREIKETKERRRRI